jgi:hypothetical protein
MRRKSARKSANGSKSPIGAADVEGVGNSTPQRLGPGQHALVAGATDAANHEWSLASIVTIIEAAKKFS